MIAQPFSGPNGYEDDSALIPLMIKGLLLKEAEGNRWLVTGDVHLKIRRVTDKVYLKPRSLNTQESIVPLGCLPDVPKG